MGIAYQPGVQFPCPELKCGRVRPFSSPGGLAERSNAADLKSVSPQGLGGSNPSPSATFTPQQPDKHGNVAVTLQTDSFSISAMSTCGLHGLVRKKSKPDICASI